MSSAEGAGFDAFQPADPSIDPQCPSPALVSLLNAAKDASCDFASDARVKLRPLVQTALQEEAAAPDTAGWAALQDNLLSLVSDLGWDAATADFSVPVDPRALTARLKASMLSQLTLVGEGSYSTVYRALNRLDGSTVTLKKLRLDGAAEGLPATAVREMSLLRELSGSPHIVQLLDVLYDRSRIYLVLEHLDMDLAEYLRRSSGPPRPAFIRSTIYQILLGVESAHRHRVIHRDLKPQNVLVDRCSGRIKLADFGLSRTCMPPLCGVRSMTRKVVTLLYRAPEILLGCPRYSAAVDLWSVGCMLAELALGESLFAGDSEIGQLYQIFQLVGTPDEGSWPGVTTLPEWHPLFPKWQPQPIAERLGGRLCEPGIELLSQLLQPNPEHRVTASQALRHAYFDPVRNHRGSNWL